MLARSAPRSLGENCGLRPSIRGQDQNYLGRRCGDLAEIIRVLAPNYDATAASTSAGTAGLTAGSFRLSRPGERKAISACSSALAPARPMARGFLMIRRPP